MTVVFSLKSKANTVDNRPLMESVKSGKRKLLCSVSRSYDCEKCREFIVKRYVGVRAT
jgi:hypothetical protein